MSGTVLDTEEEPNTFLTFSHSQTKKDSNNGSQANMGTHGLPPPPQPLWLLCSLSFLDLCPE